MWVLEVSLNEKRFEELSLDKDFVDKLDEKVIKGQQSWGILRVSGGLKVYKWRSLRNC